MEKTSFIFFVDLLPTQPRISPGGKAAGAWSWQLTSV